MPCITRTAVSSLQKGMCSVLVSARCMNTGREILLLWCLQLSSRQGNTIGMLCLLDTPDRITMQNLQVCTVILGDLMLIRL
jgi:hypothetical protein